MKNNDSNNSGHLQPKKFRREVLKKNLSKVQWNQNGKVCDIVGTIVEVVLPQSQLGTLVAISTKQSEEPVLGEVVGFKAERVLILPYASLSGIAPGCIVTKQQLLDKIPAGDWCLGKIVNPFIQALGDQILNVPENGDYVTIDRPAPDPIDRQRITRPLGLGIRAIDGLLTFGNGQRLGVMAGSGVGKSVLMGMIARGSEADVNIIGLIGERGREVREFIERDLGKKGLERSIVVVVTSDQSPLMKIRGAKVATALAEYFASKGKNVLLMMDSLTRVATAQREIGLAIGEPPTTKGYTPSVFSLLPKLLERSGPQKKGWGAISGLYTVLVDGDDFNDPIADAARSILDGHINLTRQLASKGHFPAIDISSSISRVMNDVVSKEHIKLANRFRAILATYLENFDLVQIGAYERGSNPALDEALQLMDGMNHFLKQDAEELRITISQTLVALAKSINDKGYFQETQSAKDNKRNLATNVAV